MTVSQTSSNTARLNDTSSKNPSLLDLILEALDDLKAVNPVTIGVNALTEVMDTLVVVSGTSSRHVKSLAQHVASEAKDAGFMPIGLEGEDTGEWVLVDFGDIVVHVMQPSARAFYDLEKLWSVPATTDTADLAI